MPKKIRDAVALVCMAVIAGVIALGTTGEAHMLARAIALLCLIAAAVVTLVWVVRER